MKRYPSWWPAVLWVGVSAVCVVLVFPEPVTAALNRATARIKAATPVKAANAPDCCARNAFGRCKP